MIQEFEYRGKWYIPEHPEKQIPGILKFTPNEGAILELMGSFKGIEDVFNKFLQPEIILGVSTNGKFITLFECFETKSNLSFPGTLTTNFYANMTFIGAHFGAKEDLKFKKMSIHYSNLDEWVNISGFNILRSKQEVLIKCSLQEPILAATFDDYRIYIDSLHNVVREVSKEVGIKQETHIRIESSEEKPLEECLSIIDNVQHFLCLATLKPVFPLIIRAVIEDNETTPEEDKSENILIDIFWKLRNTPTESKSLTPYDMFFTLTDIQGQLPTFLKNWFRMAELLKPVYDLYFATLYNPRMYLQHRFLSLIQGIESYHRRTMSNFELTDEEHGKRIGDILNTSPEVHKVWLKNKLAYSNEPNLRHRLKELLEVLSDLTNKFIPDRDSFIQKVVATRNYLTHYDESLKKQCAEGVELSRLTRKLKILLEIHLLKEIGFALTDIKALITRNTKYRKEFKF